MEKRYTNRGEKKNASSEKLCNNVFEGEAILMLTHPLGNLMLLRPSQWQSLAFQRAQMLPGNSCGHSCEVQLN